MAPDVSAPLQKVRVQSSTDPGEGKDKVLVKEDAAGGGKDADDQGNGHANGHANGHGNGHGNAYGHQSQNGSHKAIGNDKRPGNGRKSDASYKGSHGNGNQNGNGHGKGHQMKAHGRSRH